jgi:hypothetical protein
VLRAAAALHAEPGAVPRLLALALAGDSPLAAALHARGAAGPLRDDKPPQDAADGPEVGPEAGPPPPRDAASSVEWCRSLMSALEAGCSNRPTAALRRARARTERLARAPGAAVAAADARTLPQG